MNRRFLAAGAALVALGAFSVGAAVAQEQVQTVPSQSEASPSSIPPTDLDFVLCTAMAGMDEVALGDLAKGKAQSEEVKNLADLIVREHTTANEELMQLASGKGIPVPKTTGEVTQTVAASMSELSGPDFDLQYVLQQHGAHLAAVQLFRHATQHAMDPDVKAFAAKYAPAIEAHTAAIEKVGLELMKKPGTSQ
jgi:putative membrane protein